MMKKLFLSIILFVSFVGLTQAQTTLYTQAFTTSPSDWTATSPVSVFATPGTASPVSGGNAAGKSAAGTTPAGGRFLSKTTDISTTGYTSIAVTFYANSNTTTSIASPANMTVDFSTNAGTSWTSVTFTQLTTANTWTQLTANLPVAAEGQATLRIRFAFKSFTNASRYYIDDIAITGVANNQFYSKATGTLDLLSSWTDDPTGVAGTSPTNFTTNNQVFNLRNGNPGTLGGNLTISGTGAKLVVESGHTFYTDATNSYTGVIDVNSGGTADLGNVSVPTLGTLGATSTVAFTSMTSQTIPVASYANLTIDNAEHTLAGSISIPSTCSLTINFAGTLAIGDNNTLTVNGTFVGSGQLDGAASPDPTTNPSFVFASASSSTINIGNNQHFKNLTISNAVTLTLGTLATGQIEVNNLLTWGNTNSKLALNDNALILEGDITGNGEFVGSSNSVLAVYNTFFSTALTGNIGFITTTTASDVEIHGRNATLSTNLTAVDLLWLDAASLTISGTRTITIQDAFIVENGAALVPGTSTFNYSGATNLTQTVAAVNYNNLTISGTRTTNSVTLDAGTIGITGNYNCTATFTTGSYIVTGNTVDFNGTTMQIIKSNNRKCIFNDLQISSGTVTDNTTGGNPAGFEVKGNFTNNATFVAHATNPVIIDGTGAQSIGGTSTTSFNYLNVTSTGTRTVTVSAPVNMIVDLTVTGPATGTLTVATGGNVTLKSTSSANTARVAAITNPNNVTFTGNFNIERFALGGTTGYALLSSPGTSGNTFADWNDDFAITCASCPDGYNVGGSNFASIYTYSETVGGAYDNAPRYVEISSISDPMTNAQGFWVYLGDGQTTTNNITIDVTGPIVKGNVSIPLTLTGAYDSDHGWNLIGNPYPSPISWTALRNGNASVDNEIQVYNADLNGGTGGYAVYSGGVSTPAVGSGGQGDNIAMGQGFYVHTHANLSLTAQESNKSATRTDLLRESANGGNHTNSVTVGTVFRLAVEGVANYHDEVAFHFNANATTGWDQDYDGTKWNNMDPASANISSTTGGYNLAINALPPLGGVTTIPVMVLVGTDAMYNIIPLEMNNLPAGACVMLHDNLLNTDHDLRTGPYSCAIATSETGSRFVLTISLTNTLNVTGTTALPTCANTSNGALTAVGDNGGPWSYYWKDSLNNIVQTTLNTTTADTLQNVGVGVYSVDVVTIGSCDNGSQTFTVSEPPAVNASFSAPDTVYMNNGSAAVNFTDASTMANAYAWDFGDGSGFGSSQNPSYTYTNPGFYTVMMMAYNTSCGDSSEFDKVVVVMPQPVVVGLLNNEVLDNAAVVQDQDDAYVRFHVSGTKNATISVTDILGREVVKAIPVKNAANQTVALGLGDVHNQVLFITISGDNQQKVTKIVKN